MSYINTVCPLCGEESLVAHHRGFWASLFGSNEYPVVCHNPKCNYSGHRTELASMDEVREEQAREETWRTTEEYGYYLEGDARE